MAPLPVVDEAGLLTSLAPRWLLTTSEVLGTQVAHLSCDDYGGFLY